MLVIGKVLVVLMSEDVLGTLVVLIGEDVLEIGTLVVLISEDVLEIGTLVVLMNEGVLEVLDDNELLVVISVDRRVVLPPLVQCCSVLPQLEIDSKFAIINSIIDKIIVLQSPFGTTVTRLTRWIANVTALITFAM